mmetsp:Transcript_24043/g.32246  ORF Transcript_24043/g.32246 Transcript_24043/m.32246 type:complete len:102 (+) Transcript_24043:1128-1433(+)
MGAIPQIKVQSSNHDFLNGLDGLNHKDVRKIEERNRVLVGTVRQNIDKIDRIVKRISTVSRSAIRGSATSAPLAVVQLRQNFAGFSGKTEQSRVDSAESLS